MHHSLYTLVIHTYHEYTLHIHVHIYTYTPMYIHTPTCIYIRITTITSITSIYFYILHMNLVFGTHSSLVSD